MKLRVMNTSDVERIVRQEFNGRTPPLLHAYLTTFHMMCRKHRLAIVQTDIASYGELLNTDEIEVTTDGIG